MCLYAQTHDHLPRVYIDDTITFIYEEVESRNIMET